MEDVEGVDENMDVEEQLPKVNNLSVFVPVHMTDCVSVYSFRYMYDIHQIVLTLSASL